MSARPGSPTSTEIAFQPATEALSYRLLPSGRGSRRRLEGMRDQHRGERCFIIGNGPSLLKTDLSMLRHEYTFGLNRGYLLFDRIGAPTTFLVAVNRYVVEQFAQDLIAAPSTTFVSWRSRRWIPADSHVTFVRRARPFTFSTDTAQGAWEKRSHLCGASARLPPGLRGGRADRRRSLVFPPPGLQTS